MQLDYRGQAVLALLSDYLPENQLQAAMQAWVSRYTHLSKLALGQYIDLFHEQVTKPVTKEELYRKLLGALVKAENGPVSAPVQVFEQAPPPLDLFEQAAAAASEGAAPAAKAESNAIASTPPMPTVAELLNPPAAAAVVAAASSAPVAAPAAAAPVVASIDVRSKVFSAMVEQLYKPNSDGARKNLLAWLDGALSDVCSDDLAQRITTWLRAGAHGPVDCSDASVDQLRDVVNTFYAGLCIGVGPVKADAMLFKAGDAGAKAADGGDFDPNELL